MRQLTPFGIRSSESIHSGNVTQSQSIPSCMASNEMASLRDIISIERSRSSGFMGAKPKPQLPRVTDVTPCQPEMVQYGSHWICES